MVVRVDTSADNAYDQLVLTGTWREYDTLNGNGMVWERVSLPPPTYLLIENYIHFAVVASITITSIYYSSLLFLFTSGV